MSNQWLRLWHDMPNDPKWRSIAKISKQSISEVVTVYLHILVSASTNATERGRTHGLFAEDLASALDMEIDQIEAILKAMEGRVIEKDKVTGWSNRQPIREDNSAERSKAWREMKKEEKANVAVQANATERNRTQPNKNERDRTQDKTRQESKKERKKERDLEREEGDVDNFLEIENYDCNNLIVCADACCALLGKKKLDELDGKALVAWHSLYDMNKFMEMMQNEIILRIRKKLKPPNSLRFFDYLTRQIPITKTPDPVLLFG